MRVIKKVLHEKRKTTEAHIQQLQQAGKQGVRYTAMMPDIPFLMLGLISDIGWMIHLIAGVIYFCRNGFCHVLDYAALLALAGVLFGAAYLIYLNKIHEKEIATKLQKNLSFGITVYSGLAGAVVGMTQITTAGVSSVLVWLIVGGVLRPCFRCAVCGKRKRNSADDRAGNDAPLTLSYKVVFCKDRPEHRQG